MFCIILVSSGKIDMQVKVSVFFHVSKIFVNVFSFFLRTNCPANLNEIRADFLSVQLCRYYLIIFGKINVRFLGAAQNTILFHYKCLLSAGICRCIWWNCETDRQTILNSKQLFTSIYGKISAIKQGLHFADHIFICVIRPRCIQPMFQLDIASITHWHP